MVVISVEKLQDRGPRWGRGGLSWRGEGRLRQSRGLREPVQGRAREEHQAEGTAGPRLGGGEKRGRPGNEGSRGWLEQRERDTGGGPGLEVVEGPAPSYLPLKGSSRENRGAGSESDQGVGSHCSAQEFRANSRP